MEGLVFGVDSIFPKIPIGKDEMGKEIKKVLELNILL